MAKLIIWQSKNRKQVQETFGSCPKQEYASKPTLNARVGIIIFQVATLLDYRRIALQTFRIFLYFLLFFKIWSKYDPSIKVIKGNPMTIAIMDSQSFNDEFHKTFQEKNYKKQIVNDSSTAIQEFLDSDGYVVNEVPQQIGLIWKRKPQD